MFTPGGEPNRRGFLDGPAKRPSFPSPLTIGNQSKWRKSEVERWAEDEQRIQAKERGLGCPAERTARAANASARPAYGDEARTNASTPAAAVNQEPVIPFELRAIGADEVGALLGLSPRTVLEKVACRPDFPTRLSMRPATWVAGEVLEWRETNRAPKGRRRGPRPRG